MTLKLSERLRELMFERVKSDQLSKNLNISGQTIRAWCNGSQYIFLSNLVKLADYFCCSLDFLVGKTDKLLDYAPKERPPFYTSLRNVMQAKNVSRYRMAKESKIKDSYFTVWKNGGDPHVLSLIEAADYLAVTLDQLVGRESLF